MNSVLIIILLTVGTTFAEESGTVSLGGSKKECVRCPSGSFVVKDCEAGDRNSTVCRRCPPGRFAPSWNNNHLCKRCSHCSANQIKIANCHSSHDVICGCPPGYWHEQHGTSDAKCIQFLKCGKGVGVDKLGTNISDVTCTRCIESVNFSPVSSSFETCRPCRNCTKEGWKERKACTVMSDAECDIPTTIIPTTEPGTTPTSRSTIDNDVTSKEDHPSGSGPVVGIVSAFVFAAIVVGIIGVVLFIYYRRRDTANMYTRNVPSSNQPDQAPSHQDPDTNQNDVKVEIPSPDLQSGNGTATLGTTATFRKSYSRLELKPHIILENDVFPWLGLELGEDFLMNTYKFLPGTKLTPTDVEHACHQYQNPPKLAAKIDAVFRKWRDMNFDDEKNNDRKLFIGICKTLSQAGQDTAAIAEQMETKFAQ